MYVYGELPSSGECAKVESEEAKEMSAESLQVTTMDFGGQPEYLMTHPISFRRCGALYLLCYNPRAQDRMTDSFLKQFVHTVASLPRSDVAAACSRDAPRRSGRDAGRQVSWRRESFA